MQVKRLAALLAAAPLTTLPLVAVSLPAAAQTNVTLYGIVDAAVSSQDSGGPEGRQTVVNSGNQSSSRFGFRGAEDLGNGLKAIFNLEAGVAVDTGAADSALFGRRAVVGLEGDFGAVTVGREYSPIASIAAATDAFGQGFYGSNLSAFTTNRLTRRLSNSVNYKSTGWHGLKLLAAYAAGEVNAVNTPSGDLRGLGVEYTLGGLYLGGAYHQIKRVGADDDREAAVGAGYKFDALGGLEIKGNWMQADREGTPAKFKQVNLGGSVPFGAHRVYANLQQNKQGGAKGNAWALAYTYSLSKRTNLYASYADLNNNRLGVFGLNSSSTAVAPAATALGADPSVLSLGIRHAF
ncbi:porin [Massilia forsythiae]|uniref:Porin n=1 Tax=Massilia forsythiae TaxID=2728020 RepID=A0A7Z2VSM9_9BURK|nr:porin [Massilia forsythiae]QJD98725.1 porin [Massilia forsythiae]